MTDDLETELAAHAGRKPSKLTIGLAAGVVLVAGVLIGIQGQKAFGGTATQAVPGQARQAQGYGQGFGSRQPGQQGQGRAGMTVGTIEKVDGAKIHIKTMDGSTVVVTTTGETAVKVTKDGEVSDLEPGSTVVVQGDKDAATSVTEGGGMR
ncbi:hypothetical protein ACIBG8_13715 [Nonomuraea sp. NPDC050556]|uniref:hypothetical protein n=1 Tax=Nonomuraea sp. NPDC050556 TaxID=3364369 RepID=UPI00379AFE5B